ncbi:mitotic spindle biogenesis protein-like protein Spc19 [Pseudovirgaria hyperparasitica]|uniref:DASH complex subunit SPC19 n=1 Tax=Pseudovirgaria hyperparasitica TaxID=470096 RepID=A0A6A6W3I7_9PEZI|nr:mitotic spindle biogenesis protein-like protein Spc19 [Pseudovirgaria hyperparasitica]KAF2757422.1 mitotic spindle biogenesis protein-like protein Spc19 [Pseudovirgaria hyperparasitica]
MSLAASLEGCVHSLETSRRLLDNSISVLDSGVQDFPRLAKVLQTTRHFELISEPDLQTAQSSLVSEIHPEVDSLLNRVSNYLDRLERREKSLMAKFDLNEGRLGSESSASKPTRPNSTVSGRRSVAGGNGEKLGPSEVMKLKQMRLKKERLSYAVDRLTLQANQRERQLRMSMAAPQQTVG